MIVLRAGIYIEVTEELCTEAILGEHTLHHATHELVSSVGLCQNAGRRVLTLTAGIARVGIINTVGHLLAGEDELIGIDNDNIVATIYVRSVVGLVLSAQEFSHLAGETAKHLILSIYHDPFLLYGRSISRNGLVT